ncbi:hypothetical protein RI367_003931 [Sorochytrium milnesiophthora]
MPPLLVAPLYAGLMTPYYFHYINTLYDYPADEAARAEAGELGESRYALLMVSVERYSNFITAVPLVLVLAGFVEGNGWLSPAALHAVLSLFTAARIIRGEMSARGPQGGASYARKFGTLATAGTVGLLGGINLYQGLRAAVKSLVA